MRAMRSVPSILSQQFARFSPEPCNANSRREHRAFQIARIVVSGGMTLGDLHAARVPVRARWEWVLQNVAGSCQYFPHVRYGHGVPLWARIGCRWISGLRPV